MEKLELFNNNKKDEIFKKIKRLNTKRKEWKEKWKELYQNVSIEKENILLSIYPSQKLGEKFKELSEEIRNLKKINLERYVTEILEIIENDGESILLDNLNLNKILNSLLKSTIETETVNLIRQLSIEVKMAQDYTIYNRGEKKNKTVNKNELLKKLKNIQKIVESEDFDIGLKSLNQYIRLNINRFLEELK